MWRAGRYANEPRSKPIFTNGGHSPSPERSIGETSPCTDADAPTKSYDDRICRVPKGD